MKTLSTAAMREADRRCIEDLGIPGAVLMYNAGKAVYDACGAGSLGIVCGKGNNGGDGFVAATLAQQVERPVRVVLLAAMDDVKGDARTYLDTYRRLGGEIEIAETPEQASKAVAALAGCAVLVDAILGTGISGSVRGAAGAAIAAWPSGPTTVSVDIPSGLDSDSGAVCGAAVRAAATVTMQYAKPGLVAELAAAYVGKLIVADIGIPAVCADDEAWARRTGSP